MMDVQVMRQVVDIIEQGTMPPVAQVAAERWGGQASADSLAYVRSSANHIFRFAQAGEPRYLRLTPAARRSRAALEAELAVIQHVGQSGLAVAQLIPTGTRAISLSCSLDYTATSSKWMTWTRPATERGATRWRRCIVPPRRSRRIPRARAGPTRYAPPWPRCRRARPRSRAC